MSKTVRKIFPRGSAITIILLAIILSLSLTGISNAKAQVMNKSEINKIIAENSAEGLNTSRVVPKPAPSTGNQTQFSTYTDPKGKFSINYPSEWTVKAPTNRFETSYEVGFISPISGPFAALVIGLSSSNTTDPRTITTGGTPLLGESTFQEPECVKYKIDGQKACSEIITKENSTGGKQVYMHVNSFVNGHMYLFDLSSDADNFDKYLPVMEQMLASFKAPP